MNTELKIKYQNDFARVRELVNSFDPCGFIEIGAPLDEYDSLVNKILSFTYDKKAREEIRKMILYEIEYPYGCIDLSVINEPYKTKFYSDVEELLDNVEKLNLKGTSK